MTEKTIPQHRISIRPPAVAGSFYPRDVNQLSNMLDEFLGKKNTNITAPKAIIAPHAGYIYSGEIAGSVYSTLAELRDQISRVILLGPAHRMYVEGIALASSTHFATPLGNVEIDTQAMLLLKKYPFVKYIDAAHEQEHSLEVHIPFLQKILNNFKLIPLLVGDTKPEQVATILEALWGDDETLIVVSSDLSHFLDYATALKKDSNTTHLIKNFDYEKIGPHEACGCMPIRGLLKLAQQKNMSIETLDLRNSGDTAGTKDRVVGYGAYALFANTILNEENKKTVFDVIGKSIEQGLEQGVPYEPVTKQYNAVLQKEYAIFITLKLDGKLRGCIGTTETHLPLINAVAKYAYAAAFSDPRFEAVSANEYKQLEISLSILTAPTPLKFEGEQDLISKLRPGNDGLIIEKNNARATFLPVVWESLQQPEQFLTELKKKAGIKSSETPDYAWRYSAEYYS
jgi:AmmeMemoRadiSam system protein B/AmmeMemoRadiSam system protein A